ncbi:MAG: DUF177 domain-containing protein [Gammaproteobacteria bacterium]|nr:DUF177 domain-containing protein [Gammaproteobacteria bacterium]
MPVVFEIDVDPYLQARRARHIQGSIAVAKFERLVDALQRDEGDVEVDIDFSSGARGRPQFQLAVKATLSAECQRCLSDFNFIVSSVKTMLVVKDAAAIENVPAECEPVLVLEDELLSLMAVIEDELLLSLPAMPKHDDCQMAVDSNSYDDGDEEEELEERVNPFAVLSQLKKK